MSTALETLRQYWGYESFRPGQAEAVEALISGCDVLALMPTGGGKSLCYQVPGMALPGCCLVVSPLIALMQDQVSALQEKGIKAQAVHGMLGQKRIGHILDEACYGDLKFLYVSPERLNTEMFRLRKDRFRFNLIAVDEAHCISQWGHDFRPQYRRIGEFRELMPHLPMIAVTATATQVVAEDITTQLRLKDAVKVQNPFSRPNLAYIVSRTANKEQMMRFYLQQMVGSGIVYAPTRKEVERLQQTLTASGIRAGRYHAGMDAEQRKSSFESWMKDETRVMVATNAFGMGVDKPDVRFVLHAHVPATPEAYFQEAGRAGRDGEFSRAILFHEEKDIEELERQPQDRYPDMDTVKRVYEVCANRSSIAEGSGSGVRAELDIHRLSERYSIRQRDFRRSLELLELNGHLLFLQGEDVHPQVMVLLNNTQLYDLRIRKDSMAELLQGFLRLVPGCRDVLRAYDPSEMLRMTRLPRDRFEELLKMAQERGMIDHVAGVGREGIIWQKDRLPLSHVSLSMDTYASRKKDLQERVGFMHGYVESKSCRSQMMVAYYTGEEGEPCGICDNCKGLDEKGLNTFYKKKLRELLLKRLEGQSVNLDRLAESLPPFLPEEVLEQVRMAEDEGLLVVSGQLVSLDR